MAWHVVALGKSRKVEQKIVSDMVALKLEGIEGQICDVAMDIVSLAVTPFKEEDAIRVTASGNVTDLNGTHLSILVEPVHGFVE